MSLISFITIILAICQISAQSSDLEKLYWQEKRSHEFRKDYGIYHEFLGPKLFYKVNTIARNWNLAYKICKSEGGTLFVPQSAKVLMRTSFSFRIHDFDQQKLPSTRYDGIFIGIHSQFADGHFVTLKGEPIDKLFLKNYWAQGFPDSANSTERCVIVTKSGLLEARSCNDEFPFFCQAIVTDIKYNEECQNNDMGYKLQKNGKCYKFHEEPLSWHDAFLVCHSEQGRLAIMNSNEEATIITDLFGKQANNAVPELPNSDILLIGFSDLMYPFQYRTTTDQSLEDAGYAKWSSNKEPVTMSATKRCGAISKDGLLLITDCEQPAMFLCERLLEAKITTTSTTTKTTTSTTTKTTTTKTTKPTTTTKKKKTG